MIQTSYFEGEICSLFFSYLKRKKKLSHDKQVIITFVHVCLSPILIPIAA